MRILWVSNAPWAPTGYGKQTALFTPRIKAMGHEVAIFAFYGLEGSMLMWDDGIPVYPRLFEAYGRDAVAEHAKQFRADVIITLMDVAVVQPTTFCDVPWVAWAPVDCEPVRPVEKPILGKALSCLALSHFGEEQLARAGVLDMRYVPHGVDTKHFAPGGKIEARERLGFPKDAYIFGMVGINKNWPSRKAFPEHVMAFREFRRKHSDAILYLHTYRGAAMEGVDLLGLVRSCGLAPGRDVVFGSEYAIAAGLVSEETLVRIYQSMDVLLNVSYGEGFGVPILEAQACGTPVVVGDWTAMPELLFWGNAVPRERSQLYFTKFSSWQRQPSVEGILAAMEDAYAGRWQVGDARVARERALEFDTDTVAARHLESALTDVESWLDSTSGLRRGALATLGGK